MQKRKGNEKDRQEIKLEKNFVKVLKIICHLKLGLFHTKKESVSANEIERICVLDSLVFQFVFFVRPETKPKICWFSNILLACILSFWTSFNRPFGIVNISTYKHLRFYIDQIAFSAFVFVFACDHKKAYKNRNCHKSRDRTERITNKRKQKKNTLQSHKKNPTKFG